MNPVIEIHGARQNNLQNVDVAIPRDALTVITGVSGSGKSSLAFDVIYAEAQRRLLDSLSGTTVRHRVAQPDVDLVLGLSPAVAIDQRRPAANPRSTVGTITDIYDYLRLLFATAAQARCPVCEARIGTKTASQMVERILALPAGAEVEIAAWVEKMHAQSYGLLFDHIRRRGYGHVRVDGARHAIGDDMGLDEATDHTVEVIADRFVVRPDRRMSLAETVTAIADGLGEGFLRIDLATVSDSDREAFYHGFACPDHHAVMVQRGPSYFAFNAPESACTTCGGLGSRRRADPRLFVRRPNRSIRGGALVPQLLPLRNEAGLHWLIVYSLSKHFGFSLETPWCELPDSVHQLIFYGAGAERITVLQPEPAAVRSKLVGKTVTFGGFVNIIERRYQSWSAQQSSGHTIEHAVFERLMTEQVCPDCSGRRLKKQRLLATIGGKDIHELTSMQIADCLDALKRFSPSPGLEMAVRPILGQITRRLGQLVEVGVGYLNLARRSDTLSAGEAQRVKLGAQFGSGLMGMLYILDEPSIGLHARDTSLIVQSLQRLRDAGNTVIVVEHDVQTIAAADHIVEMGPGAGANGGRIVAHGTMDHIMAVPDSPTGMFLSGKACIPTPMLRRTGSAGWLRIEGAAENNLQNIDVSIPLGVMVCVTGVSGSGKSTLVQEVIYKALRRRDHPAVIPGAYRSVAGDEAITSVVNVDQSPIGRTSRSNPATYVGFYDHIRRAFSALPDALAAGLSSTDFSFNSKDGGRCKDCLGGGTITTKLQFMPDMETVCPTCHGKRFCGVVLDVKWNGLSIADVLELSVDGALAAFSADEHLTRKLRTMADLGLGYLKLGQPATTLSGGEAQRVKLATELTKMRRGVHTLYILDEPTTGLHLADIAKLIQSMARLVDAGHTVIVIEHHLDIIKCADFIVDLGPEGGAGGGRLVAVGTPEDVAKSGTSHTGRYLSKVLSSRST